MQMDFNVVVSSCAVRSGFDRDAPNFVVLRSIPCHARTLPFSLFTCKMSPGAIYRVPLPVALNAKRRTALVILCIFNARTSTKGRPIYISAGWLVFYDFERLCEPILRPTSR